MPAPDEGPGSCLVQVRGHNTADGPLVLVVFDHPAGIRRASAPVVKTPASLRFDHLPIGDYQVVLARSRQCARLAYLSRVNLQVQEGQVSRAELSCDTRELALKLALDDSNTSDGRQASIVGIPVLLRRVGDPAWRYRQPFSGTAGETMVRSNLTGNVVFKDLGVGRYRLDFDGFQATQEDQARLTFELGSFDTNRPIRGLAR